MKRHAERARCISSRRERFLVSAVANLFFFYKQEWTEGEVYSPSTDVSSWLTRTMLNRGYQSVRRTSQSHSLIGTSSPWFDSLQVNRSYSRHYSKSVIPSDACVNCSSQGCLSENSLYRGKNRPKSAALSRRRVQTMWTQTAVIRGLFSFYPFSLSRSLDSIVDLTDEHKCVFFSTTHDKEALLERSPYLH